MENGFLCNPTKNGALQILMSSSTQLIQLNYLLFIHIYFKIILFYYK
jgi:hypothetical protein